MIKLTLIMIPTVSMKGESNWYRFKCYLYTNEKKDLDIKVANKGEEINIDTKKSKYWTLGNALMNRGRFKVNIARVDRLFALWSSNFQVCL